MNDHLKPKEQLIRELEVARARIAELELTCKQNEVEQKELLSAEREQRALAEALSLTGIALTSTFRRDEVLDRILEQISRVVNYDAACILLIEGEKGRVFRWRGYARFSASNFVVSAIPNLSEIPVLQRVRDTHEPLVVTQANPGDEWLQLPGREWIEAYAVAPIISRGRVIGLLNLDRQSPNFTDKTVTEYLQAFAGQAAIALENSWLYDRVRYEIARRIRVLKKERNFISAILDTIGALVIVLTPEGRIVRFNRAFERAVGFSVDEVKNRYFWELFLITEEIGPARDVFDRLKTGQFPSEHTTYLKTRNGYLRSVMWTNTALLDKQGAVEFIISTGLDISEQRETSKALHKTEEKYRSMTEQLPIGIYRTAQNGKLMHANQALARIFHYDSVEDLLNSSVLAVYKNPVERRKLVEQYKHGGLIQNEVQCRTKTGKFIWVRNTGRIILNRDGGIDYIGGTIEDITERKVAEEALRESEKRFRHVISSISDHIYVTETSSDGNLKTLYISPHVEVLTGYPHDQFMVDWRFWLTKVVHPHDRVIAGTQMARAIMGHSSEVEYRLIRANGNVVWVRNSIRVETKKSTKIIYGVVSDITARKQAEEALAAEQERLAVTIRSITDGVVAIDAEQRIVLVNPVGRTYLAALTTVDYGEVLTSLGTHPLDELLATSSVPDNVHEITLSKPTERIFEVAVQKMDTTRQARGWVLIIRDVTDKRAVQQRTQQQERLAAVGQLAAGIAHDFNNILTSIIGLAELSGDVPNLPRGVSQDLRRITEQGQQAARLTRQILDFGRKSISEKRPLNLGSFLKEMAKLLKRTISEDIVIDLAFEPNEYVCNGDPTQIQQVITNLAINAQDAMPGGGVLTFRLTRLTHTPNDQPPVAELPTGDWLVLSVTDTGTGVAAENIPHLFEPFFTTKEVGKGTGLGLAQVYGIVKQHEGFIDVDSQVNAGTTFTLYFPAAPILPREDYHARKLEKVPAGNGELILLVEDNPSVLDIIQSMLERLNYRVIAARNGHEALDLFELNRHDIDLVLTDITMPKMGGIALCQALHTKHAGIKVIAMSGYPLKEEQESLSQHGFTAWLPKPLNIKNLAQIVTHALK
jgi:PAS domain S-box-containing protein